MSEQEEADLATMLGYLTTDAAITRTALQRALTQAVDDSFNCISVDGDTSTNDTVLCLANGLAGNRPITEGTSAFRQFVRLLTEACQPLALAICRDGEGVTKVVRIEVEGARTTLQARQVANTIGTSNLVKTALFGEDANWGRVVMAVGKAGEPADRDHLAIWFGDVDGFDRVVYVIALLASGIKIIKTTDELNKRFLAVYDEMRARCPVARGPSGAPRPCGSSWMPTGTRKSRASWPRPSSPRSSFPSSSWSWFLSWSRPSPGRRAPRGVREQTGDVERVERLLLAWPATAGDPDIDTRTRRGLLRAFSLFD